MQCQKPIHTYMHAKLGGKGEATSRVCVKSLRLDGGERVGGVSHTFILK